ncbi:MAG: leucyl aminopeptidase family protein [Proteobacteria bacterium]|nr:leucyl aminopeptidase family protein [Pseudomonadota bacterium]
MSLPPCFASTAHEDVAHATPLIALDVASLPKYLDAQPERVRRWIAAADFKAQAHTCLLVPGENGAPLAALAGIGDASDPFALAACPFGLPPGTYALAKPGVPGAGVRIELADAILGWGSGAYRFERYRKPQRAPARLVLKDARATSSEAFAVLKACTLVRDLVNTPTQDMGPAELEAVALRLAKAYGGEVTTTLGDDLLKENFPVIHAVGRASPRAPRLIVLRWGDPSHPHVVVAGKGVCFDTGGLDIKTADGMRLMKKDMGGAAHALGLAQLVMATKLPIHLSVLIPAVENAIAGDAFRPGDVIVSRAGISVEVDNTDAEGRLVLCDALAFAAQMQPALLLDFATLTGAARVALGPEIPALFCNDDVLAADCLAASANARDPIWRMPLWPPYAAYLKSNIADLANSGASRMAGAIVAGLYLQRFVPDGIPWAHLDTYAWNDRDRPGHPAGGEALGLRAMHGLLKARFAGRG